MLEDERQEESKENLSLHVEEQFSFSIGLARLLAISTCSEPAALKILDTS